MFYGSVLYKTISMPVLRVFVNFVGCAVQRGCFKGAGGRGWDEVPFCGADWMGVVRKGI
jgi:hypothetical protein